MRRPDHRTPLKVLVSKTFKFVNDGLLLYQDEESVEQMCGSLGTQPSLPRLCGRQCHRSNTPAQELSEYYRRTITVPILDHLLSDLDTHFSIHQRTALYGLFLVPSVLVTKN